MENNNIFASGRRSTQHNPFHTNNNDAITAPTVKVRHSNLKGIEKLKMMQQLNKHEKKKKKGSSISVRDNFTRAEANPIPIDDTQLRAQLKQQYKTANPPPIGVFSGPSTPSINYGTRFVKPKLRSDHDKTDDFNRLASIKTPAVLKFFTPIPAPPNPPPSHVAQKVIEDWCQSFQTEEKNFGSVALFAEVRLQEALNATDPILAPSSLNKNKNHAHAHAQPLSTSDRALEFGFDHQSEIRAAICCDLLKKTSRMFGRYESLMETLTDQLLKCVYADYDSVLKNNLDVNARTFYECTPYFTMAKNFQIHNEDLTDELSMYNAGVDVRKALVKCSVGVRTLFNDSKRQIRDIVFRIWRAYVMSRMRKMKKLRTRVCIEPFYHLWKSRHSRFKNQGYFYDSGSESDGETDLQRHPSVNQLINKVSKENDGLNLDSPELTPTRDVHSVSPMSFGSDGSSPSVSPTPSNCLAKFRKITKKITNENFLKPSPKHHSRKTMKLLRTETDGDGKTVQVFEHRATQLKLCTVGCQTDGITNYTTETPAPINDNANAGRDNDNDNDKNKNVDSDSDITHTTGGSNRKREKTQMDVAKLMGGKKEKPMAIEAALDLIPNMFEQYMVMLKNPGPDTIGKHLNLVSFTKTAMTRKYGIKSIALKSRCASEACKAFLACLTTKKAQTYPRIRVFSDLYGLRLEEGSRKQSPEYDVEKVEFFFNLVIKNLFPNIKMIEPVFSKKEIEQEAVVDRIRGIFPNIRYKDGFKFLKIENVVETLPTTSIKGLKFVAVDDLIEELWYYWKTENLYHSLTKDEVLACNRVQKCSKVYIANLRSRMLHMKTFLPLYKKHVKAVESCLTKDEFGKVCNEIGFPEESIVDFDRQKIDSLFAKYLLLIDGNNIIDGDGGRVDIRNFYHIFFSVIWNTGFRL